MVVLNYMALHGDAIAGFPVTTPQGQVQVPGFANLYPAPNLNDTLGANLEPLIAFKPIVSGIVGA
jgi:hypothetical protein